MRKAIIIALLLLLLSSVLKAQCEPDKRFVASGSLELTSDWGFIMQGGITGQLSRFSAHIGVRAREFVDSTSPKSNDVQAKLFPRLELGLRIVNGVHFNIGIAPRSRDVSITVYGRVGEKVAVYGRGLYDGALMFGLGIKFLIYRQ